LVRELGVNLAGVEIILQLKEEIEKLQSEIEALKKAQGQIPRNRSVVIKKDTYQLILVPNKD
jgi:MerR family transcriptional regulator/heat shock protein HspR